MPTEYSKDPSFKNQDSFSVIEKISARLVVFPTPDRVYLSGSCFRVAKNLYITAKHVVTDYLEQFGEKEGVASFEIWAVHIKEGPDYSIWLVDRVWMCPLSDLAVLHTKPYNDVAANDSEIICVGLELIPPNVEERVVGFGHHSHTGKMKYGKDGTRHIEINAFGAATVGEVREIHHEKRDSSRMPFPCYQTNARFDGGMSGGPVISDRGKVCGVICSNLPPNDGDDEHISYVASLWPLMATMIDIDTNGNDVETPYLMLELARNGVISAEGWENISIQGSVEDGNFNVQIKKY